MKEYEIVTRVVECGYEEMPKELRELAEKAKEATSRAYAPYSKFQVGAAILLSNGEIVCGSNQENAAFPSGTCAERSACYYAGSQYPHDKFVAIAIAARGTDGEFTEDPTAPCGACRQALLEYEKRAGQPVRVILTGRNKVLIVDSIADLLPLTFADF